MKLINGITLTSYTLQQISEMLNSDSIIQRYFIVDESVYNDNQLTAMVDIGLVEIISGQYCLPVSKVYEINAVFNQSRHYIEAYTKEARICIQIEG